MSILQLLVLWFVTAVSLFIISKLPTGVEIDDFNIALISSAIFGLLNVFVRPVLATLALPVNILLPGLVTLIVNLIIFGLAAWLVSGFRLRWGFWSALIGSLGLTFINSFLYELLSKAIVS
ncbi:MULTISPECIES: phage holin family protein [unclassified Okeania]|uniref:phage holin family protein n=1 Tax=unclassified Okeania TaxID=2634635 RepID=UPI0013C22E86|nr:MULTISPECIES: phage holin family protein [unclassified Okeania]NET29433.1 phage holin family protein [Okeania sp. SIO1I7]NET45067.1 phage holin family protein [Okeania sp. SIO2B3]